MTIGVEALPLTFVAHALAVAGAVTVLVWNLYYRGGLAWEATNKSLIFNLHPVLMLIGLIIIGGEAIMSYKSLPLKKEVKKGIHLVLHAIAIILGSVGIAAAFKNHNESNIANLYSLHSWLGISIISLYGIQAELESIRQHKHEKIKNEEAQIQKAMEQKKAAIDAQNQKKVLEITEKADKHRSNNTLPMKCFGICTD
ncbi:transmembrane ascorbate ferrireductase 1 isoform X4 [Populus trichocarpa]|uniref:transmembrane ascorbate ferrireductase 1 isoform X4 n=1 Tax=Populus trichocarpa TaxID=3694 RepID=UPI002278FF65|nr:transmembrane ascorbate ferrireductase 1 isoform X4 [Populus trichocarpa]